ncbi:MAG: hypothetical protein L6R41_005197 [Letrouitia leprolyta]|nr:MAG: hypothetical protein L6R41_005197 [Letrouitia leprolyta]
MLYEWPKCKKKKENIRKNLPLIVATPFGLEHIVAALLSELRDIDVNWSYGRGGYTVLDRAVELGNVDLTRVLLEAGADPQTESPFSRGRTILYKAIANRHDGLVESLLSHTHGRLIEPAIIYCATFTENEAILQSIMKHSKDIFRQWLHQILFHAACLGRVSVVEFAIRLGADINAKDAKGQTALFIAVKYGRQETVESSLRKGSHVTERDQSWLSLFQLATSSQEIYEERLRFALNYLPETQAFPVTGTT